LNVYVLKKSHTINGNPLYKVFIPDISGKVKGLRKLKEIHTYSLETYNIKKHLQDYIFKDHLVRVIRD